VKKKVIDASTLLAYMRGEPGADEAGRYCQGALMSAVNLAEVFQKSSQWNKREIAQAIVLQAQIEVVPFDWEYASIVADLHPLTKGQNISLADRACLALGKAKKLPIVTGDQQWSKLGLDIELVFFRPKGN
jgi:ribonuclease VapC